MQPSRLLVAAAVTSAILTATACAPDPVEPDTSASAFLDRDTMDVVLPLDEYRLSPADDRLITEAMQTAIRTCVQSHGVNGLKPTPNGSEAEERPYGLWNSERAAEYGYDFPRPDNDVPTPPGGWSDESDPDFNRAYESCHEELEPTLASFVPPERERTTAMDLRDDAYNLASDTPEWTAARDEWKRCIADQGLTPREEETAWSSQQAFDILKEPATGNSDDAGKQEEIRIAVIEARCNESTRLTQRLADIEAQYQAALIAGHEATLNEEKEQAHAYAAAARDFLAEHQ